MRNKFVIREFNYWKLKAKLANNEQVYGCGGNFITVDQLFSVSELKEVDENALLLQIAYIKNDSNSYDKVFKEKDGSLRKHAPFIEELVYVNFSSNIPGYSLKQESARDLFVKGFEVRKTPSKSDVIYRYLPFDKSASMGRVSVMSFLSTVGYKTYYRNQVIEHFFGQVAERVHFGIDDDGLTSPLAKRYAYRGLMLSGGTRVSLDDFKIGNAPFKFSKETVLLVQDKEEDSKPTEYYTQVSKGPMDNKPGYCAFEDKPKLVKGPLKNVVTNDGYGFVSPDMAIELDKKVCTKKTGHTSFQIRLPMVKGLLHSVDFLQFSKEHKNKDGKILIRTYDDSLNECVKEMSEEELSNVKIIISKSMFKCFSDLKKHCELNNIKDALSYYWDRVNLYSHSIFVLSMNGKKEELTELNYQFLSTVALDRKDFLDIYDISKKQHDLLSQDEETRRKKLLGSHYNEADEDEESIEHLDLSTAEKWALYHHPELIFEPHFKSKADDESKALLNSMAIGNILIEGEDRYLSGDMLDYLYFINAQTMDESLRISYGRDDSFVAPGLRGVIDGDSCAILRNPHLSRNEDLSLSFHLPNKESERNKYGLNKLVGVCMVDPTDKSLPSSTVGGADYDGDHVKIIKNKLYVKAINENRQQPLVINDEYKKDFENSKESMLDTRENCLKVNSDTFSTYVGKISNLAFKEALNAYSGDKEKEDTVRLLGILTGVETDSSKTGIKPYFEGIVKKDTYSKKRSASRLFIDFKNMIDKGNPTRKKLLSNKNNLWVYDDASLTVESFADRFKEEYGREPSNVELLIKLYDIESSKTKSRPTKEYVDPFGWAGRDNRMPLVEQTTNEVISIIKAYKEVNQALNYKTKFREVDIDTTEKIMSSFLGVDDDTYEWLSNSVLSLIGKLSDPLSISNYKFQHIANKILSNSSQFRSNWSNIVFIRSIAPLNVRELSRELLNNSFDFLEESEVDALSYCAIELGITSILSDIVIAAKKNRLESSEGKTNDNFDDSMESLKKKYLQNVDDGEYVSFKQLISESLSSVINATLDVLSCEFKIVKQPKNFSKELKRAIMNIWLDESVAFEEKRFHSRYSINTYYHEKAKWLLSVASNSFGSNVELTDSSVKTIAEYLEATSARGMAKSSFGTSFMVDCEFISAINGERKKIFANKKSDLFDSIINHVNKLSNGENGTPKQILKAKAKELIYDSIRCSSKEKYDNSSNKLTQKELSRKAIQYIRAVESTCDQKQSFLWDVFGVEFVECMREEND